MSLRRCTSKAALFTLLLVGSAARAQTSAEPTVAARVNPFDRTEGTNPFRGSTIFLEQSIATQTADVGNTPQTYVPLYEFWVSFRPRYWFGQHWNVRARLDYTKELTNAEQTTYYREDVFGDLWTDVLYNTDVDPLAKTTKVYAGARALWPTSKQSQAYGTYVTAGAVAGGQHEFAINGDAAPALNKAYAAVRLAYLHPFSTATTPTDYGTFTYVRQNVDGFSFVSDQVQGQTLVSHEFWATIEGGLQITPRLSALAYLILINQWHYAPSQATVQTVMGPTSVSSPYADVQFTQNTWFLVSFDYDVLDELELSVGYYNLANAVAPDGQRRSLFGSDNIWWSPDARFFFALTANLDVLYDDAARRHVGTQAARRSGPPPAAMQ
jgi:hypothetical protein